MRGCSTSNSASMLRPHCWAHQRRSGLSQGELATRADISPTTLNRVELGRQKMYAETLVTLACVLWLGGGTSRLPPIGAAAVDEWHKLPNATTGPTGAARDSRCPF